MSLPIPLAVREQAAEWLVELQSDDHSAGTREMLLQRLQHWRESHPDHERAWLRIEAMGARLQPLSGTPASVALAQAARTARGRGRRLAVRSLVVLLFTGAGAGAVAWRGPASSGDWLAGLGADLRTGTAQRRSLRLPDGTQLQMNADSAVDLDFSPQQRLVRLRGGDIEVATAQGLKDSAPPLLVETRHGRIRALGTRFVVRQRGQGPSRVAVFEGATEIAPRERPGHLHLLQTGQQAQFDAQATTPAGPADPALAAWTRGMLVAQDMPLAEFLDQLSRYRPGHLGCDGAVAQLPVSGTYPLADTDQVLAMLLATLPVRLRTATRYWVVVEPA